MPTIELAQVGGHAVGIGQAGGRVVLGMARDRAGLGNGGLQALRAQVGGAGAALALPEEDGDGDAAVAGGFHAFDRAHAHVDVEAAVFVAADLGLAGAVPARPRKQVQGQFGQAIQAGLAVVVGGELRGKGRVDGVQCFILCPLCVEKIPKPVSSCPPAAASSGGRPLKCSIWRGSCPK